MVRKQQTPKPTYQELEQRVKMLELAVKAQGKHLTVISQPGRNLPVVPLEAVEQMNLEAYASGFDTGWRLVVSEFQRVIKDNAEISAKLAIVMAVIGELRGLVFYQRARMDATFYHQRLKQLSRELSARAQDWKNTIDEKERAGAQRSGQGSGVPRAESGPMVSYVSNIQDAVSMALRGNYSSLQQIFSNNSWHEDIELLLNDVNTGGAPAGKRDYTALLRDEARQIKAENPAWTPGQIANHIIHQYQTEKSACQKARKQFSPLKNRLLKKLEASDRPDNMVRKALK